MPTAVTTAPLPPSVRCDTRQFGQTCGLPLGRNCPWRNSTDVPRFFTLFVGPREGALRLFRVQQDLSLDLALWLNNRNPINQIIFALPFDAYYALANSTNSSALATFISRVLTKPGTVTTIPTPVINAQGLSPPGILLSTRAGNVGGVTGYYIYKPPGQNYADGDAFYLPEAVVELMPRRSDGSIEYSFYASEEYCLLQSVMVV